MKVKFFRIIMGLMLPAILLFFCPAEATALERKVVVVAVDRLSLGTLLERASRYDGLQGLLEEGGLALMNVATGGSLSTENAYASLGAGTRALGGANAALGFQIDESYNHTPVEVVFERHYGYPAREKVVFLGLSDTLRTNETRPYRVVPGALGEALMQAGKRRAIIGNADTHLPRRQSTLFLMDSKGNVGSGQINSDVLQDDPYFPFAHRLTAERLSGLFREYYRDSDVLLVDYGDLYRLEEYHTYLTPERQNQLLEEHLQELDQWIQTIRAEVTPETRVILFSPTPPRRDWGTGFMMSPVLMWGGGMERGLLTSSTTRRQGIIANTDIAASILDYLGVEQPYYMLGQPATSLPFPDGEGFLQKRFLEMARVYNQRAPLIQTYVTFQVIAVFTVLAGIFLRLRGVLIFRPYMLSLMLVPLMLLLLALLPPWPLPITMLTVYGSAFLLGILFYRFFSYRVNMIFIGLATSLILSFDLLIDSFLMQRSVLGYDAISGARYYGIGNEYMGALVGSTLLFSMTALQFLPKSRKYLGLPLGLYYLGMVALLAMPSLGANFGGTLTALTAGIMTVIILFWRPGRYKFILLGALGGALLLALFLWFNLPTPGREISHWGRSILAIREGGLSEVLNILERKAAMAVRLLRYSHWSRGFLSFLFAQALLLFRPLGVLKEMRRTYPFFMSGIMGITAGGVAAVLSNDSGVVAAAMALLFSTLPLLYLVLEKATGVEGLGN